MKTNNRPNHERKLYELRCTKHDDETHVIYSNWDFLKEDTNSRVCDGIYRATGIVKIELTPYDDAEYIEYLEKEVNERTIVARNLMGNSLSLQRENQELKKYAEDTEKQLESSIEFNKHLHKTKMQWVKGYANQQDQFLKVVESVFNDNLKEIEYGQIGVEYLLQEIKSAMEKENNETNN